VQKSDRAKRISKIAEIDGLLLDRLEVDTTVALPAEFFFFFFTSCSKNYYKLSTLRNI